MPRGNTAAIDVQVLRLQWDSHSSMAAICSFWTVSRDQLIRLRDVLPLPKRHDRRLRFKPASRLKDPTPREIAEACREIQATWNDHQREARYWKREKAYEIPFIPLDFDVSEFVEGE